MTYVPRYGSAKLNEQVLSARDAHALADDQKRLLRCRSCGERAQAVRFSGSFYVRHYTPSGGERGPCRTTGESSEHVGAKLRLARWLGALIDRGGPGLWIDVPCPQCGAPAVRKELVALRRGDLVVMEYLVPGLGIVADLAVLRDDAPVVLFEIWATHQVEDAKWRKLASSGLRCIEVDALALVGTSRARRAKRGELRIRAQSPAIPPCDTCTAPTTELPAAEASCSKSHKQTQRTASPQHSSAIDQRAYLGVPDWRRRMLLGLPVVDPPPRTPRKSGGPSTSIASAFLPRPVGRSAFLPLVTEVRAEPVPAVVSPPVVDWGYWNGLYQYRVRSPTTWEEGMHRSASARAEMEQVCRTRGWLLAPEAALLAPTELRKPRSHRHWSESREDDD